jgi:hypothetical protein
LAKRLGLKRIRGKDLRVMGASGCSWAFPNLLVRPELALSQHWWGAGRGHKIQTQAQVSGPREEEFRIWYRKLGSGPRDLRELNK